MDRQKLTLFGLFALLILVIATFTFSIITLVKVSDHNSKSKDCPAANKNETNGGGHQGGTPSKDKPLTNPLPEKIDTSDSRYDSFKYFADVLEKGLDLSQKPCDDFYKFVCENVEVAPFGEVQLNVQKDYLKSFDNVPDTPPFKKLTQYLDACDADIGQDDPNDSNGVNYKKKYEAFAQSVNVKFPIIENKADSEYPKPNALQNSELIYNSNKYNAISLFVPADIDQYMERKETKKAYTIHFTRSDLPEYYYFYTNEKFINIMRKEMNMLAAQFIKVMEATVSVEERKKQVDDVLNFQIQVAKIIEDGFGKTKNNYFTAARANSDLKLVDFSKLLSLLFSDSEKAVKDLVNDKDFEFIVHYPEIYKKLNDYINSDKVSAKTLWNHYHFSVLIGNFLMLYKVKVPDENNLNVLVQTEPFVGLTNLMKRKNEDKNLPNPLPIPEPEIPKSTLNSFTAANTYCLGKVQVDKTFRQLIDRLYLDKAYPDKQDRRVKQNFVRKLANNIIHGFQSQLNQLDWMSEESKKGAYLKISNLVKNIGFDERVEDNAYLEKFYEDLKFSDGMKLADLDAQKEAFEKRKNEAKLLSTERQDRTDFYMTFSRVNAWYMPSRNSITIPFAILQRPIYDVNYPISVVYGGIGAIVGHEIVHGFDNNGVRFDDLGYPLRWMDDDSQTNFNTMARCVIDQYGKYKYQENPIDGVKTQGENIADNGGIRASFNAYKAHIGLNGNEPSLPNDKTQALSGDQLFFVSFARTFCNKADFNPYDVHSPMPIRVFGAIQNFPEFKSAFNCRANDNYAPVDHCNVWTPFETK